MKKSKSQKISFVFLPKKEEWENSEKRIWAAQLPKFRELRPKKVGSESLKRRREGRICNYYQHLE